jgi:hypothetical protein
MEDELIEQLRQIVSDAYKFICCLQIIDKDGKVRDFIPTNEQLDILTSLLSGEDTLVLKPRQIGSSTIVAAFLFWKLYTSTEPVTIAILSYKLNSVKHLLKMIADFHSRLPEVLQRELSVSNTREFQFADSGARIIVESARATGGIRSFSCGILWLSEFAFSENPDELLATAGVAVNDGQMIIESTANYFNDAHHKQIIKAQRGEAAWNFLFFPWYRHEEYTTDIPEDVSCTWTSDELHLQNKLSLTNEQMYWRRLKIEKIGWEKFIREYPVSIDEAYQQLGNAYIKQPDHLTILPVEPVELCRLSLPDKDDKYAIGVDTSGGVGRDYSVIQVLSKRTNQQVCIWRSNKTPPVLLAHRIQEIATQYNNALVLIESNNMGAVVLRELAHLGFNNFWSDEDDNDWLTTGKSKTLMFELLKKAIGSGQLNQIDSWTFSEIRAITVNEKGNIILPDTLDSHADSAVALALAIVCLESVTLPKIDKKLPSFIQQKIVKRITSTNSYNRY